MKLSGKLVAANEETKFIDAATVHGEDYFAGNDGRPTINDDTAGSNVKGTVAAARRSDVSGQKSTFKLLFARWHAFRRIARSFFSFPSTQVINRIIALRDIIIRLRILVAIKSLYVSFPMN